MALCGSSFLPSFFMGVVIRLPLFSLIDSENITSVEVSAPQMKMATYLFDLQVKDIRDMVTASLSEIFAKTNIYFKSKDFSFTSKNFEDYEKKENI